MRPSKGAFRLMQEGSNALSQVESNGMRIDVGYLDKTLKETAIRLKELRSEFARDPAAKEWKKLFGPKTNFSSNDQLSKILFGTLGLKPQSFTNTGKPKVDVTALESIDLPFLKVYGQIAKLEKLYGTYLKGIKREVVGEYLHPVFSLHKVKTYRSSSSNPNFQNMPNRDLEASKLIRQAFIPREGHVFVEIDYASIEVRIAACYHQDPTMLEYIETGHDMHKDMAVECFMLTKDQVSKPARHAAKNKFVFPEFYGANYISIAKGLWDAVTREELQRVDGVLIKDHLSKHGIRKLGACNPKEPSKMGTFEKHIRDVEHRFWNSKFPVYKDWRESLWEQYQQDGFIKTLTGFIVQGVMGRTEVINFPVQGSAFHCLLWALIHVQKEFNRLSMRSMIVGQIHDSIVLDVAKEELDDVLQIAQDVMCERLRLAWKWIRTPLEVEAEGSEVNWHEKKVLKI